MADHEREEAHPSLVFWLVVGLAGLYLGLRLIQGVIWLVGQLG